MSLQSGAPEKRPNPPVYRVGIAEDHAITRAGLRAYLDAHEDLRVVGEAWDGSSTIDLVRQTPMDVLLLDLQMPGRGGLDALHMIRARAPCIGILVVSGMPASQYAMTVMRMGANGYLSKECEPKEIVEATRTVAQGRRFLTPEVSELLASELTHEVVHAPHESLTDREFQLLLHMARGLSSTEIAKALSLSCKTVSTYRGLILKKLDLRTNSEMTRYCLTHKLID